MKEFFVMILLLLVVAAGYTLYLGTSHSVNFYYNCGLEIPWYEAIFLDITKCPGMCEPTGQ